MENNNQPKPNNNQNLQNNNNPNTNLENFNIQEQNKLNIGPSVSDNSFAELKTDQTDQTDQKKNREEKLKSKIKLSAFFVLLAIILLLLNVGIKFINHKVGGLTNPVEMINLQVNSKPLTLEVADSKLERETGLSGRRSMPLGTGLLMVFDELGNHGIWMKDMNFAIDVLWLAQDFKIVHSLENLLPETYPNVFYPETDTLYVIELPAGSFEKFSLSLGQKIEIPSRELIAE